MKIKIDPINIVLSLLILILLILWATSCNPVKQVLRDKQKLDQVAEQVVRMGYCANDTTFITSSDTTIQIDTLVQVDTAVQYETINDTIFVTKWKTRDILKSVIIHDTLKSVVVDNARLKLISADLAAANAELKEWKGKARDRGIMLILCLLTASILIYLKSKK
jgi:hypothetical protein